MPNVESDIEGVSFIDEQQLTTSLDNDIQTNIENIDFGMTQIKQTS